MKLRAARDDDHAAIAAVAERSDLLLGDLNRHNFPSLLTWLYTDAPARIRLQFVAEHDDAVVAHYGAVPFAYKLLDEMCVAAFASNLVIDRDHRAGMLFLSLQSYLQREYKRHGFRFAYGLITRANVLEPHLRMGWKRIGTVPVYAKPFRFPAVAASVLTHPAARALAHVPLTIAQAAWRAYWSRSARDVAVEEVTRFEPEADAFLAGFMAGREIAALRTREILNWRFAAYAGRTYRIFIARKGGRFAGYVVTRNMPLKDLSGLSVVDLAYDPADDAVARALLRRCDHEAMRAGADVAAIILNPASPFFRHLRRAGYLRTPEAFTLVVHAPKDAPPPAFTPELFARWHVTWFEHDYV